MARGKQVYLDYSALVLLGYVTGAFAEDIWAINIDNTPAPPPDLGPPFSANAIRDKTYLPYQILGILASYLIVILFIGTLILSCGQRARKRAQMMTSDVNGTEMVKPAKNYYNTSAISPQEQRSWYSPDRLKSKKSVSASIKSLDTTRSPAGESVASFDTQTIEADKQRRAAEMERLYAAVMAQDDRRSQARSEEPRSPYGAPPEYTQRPPRSTDGPHLRHLQQDQFLQSPRSPVKAIYPSENPFSAPPLSPAAFSYAEQQYPPANYSNSKMVGHERGGSLGSSQSTISSPAKKSRKSLKNLQISAPIMRHDDNDDGMRTPLSPRVYTDPGIPPEPPTAGTIDTFDSTLWPTTPGTARSFAPEADYPYPEEDDQVHDLPARPSQRSLRGKGKQNYSQPLRLEVPQQQSNAVASTQNVLPFRQLHWNTPSSPLYPYQGQGPFSAGPTKTTFVEARRERFGAPLTGMATPYSAYMPFTPLTPVTPHLTTRTERRQREREDRQVHGAITEEDQVVDDKELWDEGY